MRVPRRVDERIREELLVSIVDALLESGLAGLSLRPLSAAVGVSPRTLLYHFGSKEGLVGAALDEANRRQVRLLEAWYERSAEHDVRTLLLRAWHWLAAPRNERLLRLTFEIQAIALRDRRRYAGFLRTGNAGWSAPFAKSLMARGFAGERAQALATVLVAVVRGLLLDVFSTGDRARAERAFRSFLSAIELPD